MPVGPVEIGPLWYARSRLAFVTFGCFAWGSGMPPQGQWYLLMTRVMEKTSEFTIALLRRIIELLPPCAERKNISYWSDVGPHFRTYKVLGSIGLDLLRETRLDQSVYYGMEELVGKQQA